MVGVVIVWPVRHDDVGVGGADLPRDLAAVFERGHQLAVVVVEDDGGRAEDLCGFLDFLVAALGERAAGHPPVADVAVGDRDERYRVPAGGPHRRDAAGLQFAIVRVGAEGDDAERCGWGRSRRT